MPKGSKKRRAEKRKKEKEAHITSPTNSTQGSEDLKSQSDSGEVSFSSATTSNHNKKNSSTSDTSEERLGHGVVVGSEVSRSIEVVSERKKKKKEEEDVVEISRDLKVQKEEEEVEGGRDSVKRIVSIESVKETSSDSGSGSGSGSGSDSGSSSDDESEAIEKKIETKKHEDLIEKVVSISEDVEIVEVTPAEKTGDSGVIDLPSKEMVQVVVVVGGDVSSCESNNGYEHRKEATITETSNDKPATTTAPSNGYEHDEFEATSPEISDKQHLSVTPLSSENSNGSKHCDEAATTEISDNQKQQAESVPLSSEVSGRHEHRPETTTPESADKKKEQIALAQPTVQPTSWKSCCGLFDVFMGSNR